MLGWIVLAIVILVVLWLVFTYNGLISARNRTQEAWSEIDVELKRRHDLIPNLMNTVQGYMGHERGTLEAVTNASQNLSNMPVEVMEAEHPVRVEEYAFVPDTCGAGNDPCHGRDGFETAR